MRRATLLMAVFAVASLFVGVLAVPAGAAPAAKVDVCHVNGVSDAIPTFSPDTDPRMFYPGKVISVAEDALGGHEGHGDSATFRTDEAGLANVRLSAENNGLTVWKQADCFITG